MTKGDEQRPVLWLQVTHIATRRAGASTIRLYAEGNILPFEYNKKGRKVSISAQEFGHPDDTLREMLQQP
jgi:hypothetical protein